VIDMVDAALARFQHSTDPSILELWSELCVHRYLLQQFHVPVCPRVGLDKNATRNACTSRAADKLSMGELMLCTAIRLTGPRCVTALLGQAAAVPCREAHHRRRRLVARVYQALGSLIRVVVVPAVT
jgi:hypothetical protein